MAFQMTPFNIPRTVCVECGQPHNRRKGSWYCWECLHEVNRNRWKRNKKNPVLAHLRTEVRDRQKELTLIQEEPYPSELWKSTAIGNAQLRVEQARSKLEREAGQ